MRRIVFAFLCVTAWATAAGRADCWTVATIGTDSWLPNNIAFQFDGATLYLNNTYIYQPGGSSAWSQTLCLAGQWAVCGSISSGQLQADPYISFVIDRSSVPAYHGEYLPYQDVWTAVGHVTWASGTPGGHATNLYLGYSFSGDGSVHYSYSNPLWGSSATGTLVVDAWHHYSNGYYDIHHYSAVSTSYSVTTPVPEPSTILALLTGLAGIGGMVVRRRK